jgi:hypothetical protein
VSPCHESTLAFFQSSSIVQTASFSFSQSPFLCSLSFFSSESNLTSEWSSNHSFLVTDFFTTNFRFGIRHGGTAFVFRASIFFFPFPFWT